MKVPFHTPKSLRYRRRRNGIQTKGVGTLALDVHVPGDAAPTVLTVHRDSLTGYDHTADDPPVGVLLRHGPPHNNDALVPFLRDCGNHAFQLLDTVGGYHNVAQGLIDLPLAALSNRQNEIMKVLAMIAPRVHFVDLHHRTLRREFRPLGPVELARI